MAKDKETAKVETPKASKASNDGLLVSYTVVCEPVLKHDAEGAVVKDDKGEPVVAKYRSVKKAETTLEVDWRAIFEALPMDVKLRYARKEFKTTLQDAGRRMMNVEPMGEGAEAAEAVKYITEHDWASPEKAGGKRLTGVAATARDVAKAVKSGEISPEKQAALDAAMKKAMEELGIAI